MKLKNSRFSIDVSEQGAELISLLSSDGYQWLWQGDEASWPGQSPVLFPIVGVLRNGETFIKDKVYQMPCHGFARSKTFSLLEASEAILKFGLSSDESTKQFYPWDFELRISYSISESNLRVHYSVKNTDSEKIFFCLGAHPGFALKEKMNDYYLEFPQTESSETHLVASNGTIRNTTAPCLSGVRLDLKDELFFANALIFKDLQSTSLQLILKSKPKEALKFSWQGFSSLGIWSLEKAPFICFEPWNGHGDMEDTDGQFSSKSDLLSLDPGQRYECSWSVSLPEV
jgi:galactose mutarotase-like enzyme